MSTPLLPTCPKCGVTLPADAPKGLCPRCLAAMNFATETVLTGADALAAQPPLSPAELAPHFPQLEIIECLGRGGMGVVYKARQKSLNRVVALKLLAPERVSDAKFAERFTHEAQALAALNHPSIVTIYDFGQAGGFYFLLMEFVDGVNLRQAMKAGRFTPEQALAIVPPVCEALQYAHEHGIVHRDIKPENLLLDKGGRVKIADFGIAKLLHADGSDVGLADSQPAGTPQYMAPEQKEHRRTDHRADIYSLGVVLYELLTGELPADKLQPPSRKVLIDVRLDEIVLRALETKPELRYQNAGEFRTQVETVVSTPVSGQQEREQTPSTPPRIIKTGTSTITTPEKLATFTGQFFHYRNNSGQLILDDRQLTHLRDGTSTIIPLAAICDVSIGQYPRMVNPAGIDFLSVIYEEDGQRKQVLLSPMKGWFALPSIFNAHIAEWHTAIREAVIAVTGRVPASSPIEKIGTPIQSFVPLLALAAWLVPVGAALMMFTRRRETAGGFPGAVGLFEVAVFVICFFSMLLLFWLFSVGIRSTTSHSRKRRFLGLGLALAGWMLFLGAPVLNEFVDDHGLTATARKHLETRRRLGQAMAVAKQTSAIKARELNVAEEKFRDATALDELKRLRHEVGQLREQLAERRTETDQAESALNQAAVTKQTDEQHRIAWIQLLGGVLLAAGFVVFLLGIDPTGQCRRVRLALPLAPALLLGFLCLKFLAQIQSPTGITNFSVVPVGVSNNVVIVDVTTEVGRGRAELRSVLEGPRLPAATETALPDEFFPPFAGTFIKPTSHAGNHPWRILSQGRQTWRLGFVLPDAALAQEAFTNLRPIGPLPTEPDRTHAGALFEISAPNGEAYLASLQVTPPITSANPNWVSLSGHSSRTESTVTLTWELLASKHGLVQFSRVGSPITVLQPYPQTKLYTVSAQLELTKIDMNRVLFVRRIGGATVREELAGNFRNLADELTGTATFSAKTERGTSIELCQFQGKSFTVTVDGGVPLAQSSRQIGTSFPLVAIVVGALILLMAAGGIALLIVLVRKGGTAGRIVLLVIGVLLLLFGIAVFALISLRTSKARQEATKVELAEGAKREKIMAATNGALIVPQHIEFKVLRVENPPATHIIRLHFERDANYGLGFELWQTGLRGPNDEFAELDFWKTHGVQHKWIGVYSPSVLEWRLPPEMSEEEVQAGAEEVEKNARRWTRVSEGAVLEFAHVKHRAGWTYILIAEVLAEPELRAPPTNPSVNRNTASVARNGIGEPLAFFASVTNLGSLNYRLLSTLAMPRHVALGEVAFVDERTSVAHKISQLGFYLASADGVTNQSCLVTWSIEKVTNGEGSWNIRIQGKSGSLNFDRAVKMAGDKPFQQLYATPDNPDHGPHLNLNPATTSWAAVPPERAFWVGPGGWSQDTWNSITLFEARDDKGQLLGRLRLNLLVAPVPANSAVPWPETLFRNGDGKEAPELLAVFGPPPRVPNEPLSATLPNGVTVKLIGLSDYPTKGKQWWLPNGMECPPLFDGSGVDLRSLQPADERTVVCAFAITGLKSGTGSEANFVWPEFAMWGGRQFKNGVFQPEIKAVALNVPTNANGVHLRLTLDSAQRFRLEYVTKPGTSALPYPVRLPLGEVGVTFGNVSLRPGLRGQPSTVLLGVQQEATEATAAEPWGEAVDGVQALLHAERENWWKEEKPAFKLAVRNRGGQQASGARKEETVEVEIDGRWYLWTGKIDVVAGVLSSGGRFDDIAIVLDPAHWKRMEDFELLVLKPGRHTVRVCVPLPAKSGFGPTRRVISNAIKILIHDTPASAELPSYQQFDQTPGQGWRALAEQKQFGEAARMIESYLAVRTNLTASDRVNLHFHAAQVLAFVGDAKSVLDALGHLKQARYAVEPPDAPLRWNDYVAATEAFLKGDITTLKAARERIAAGPKLNGAPANLDVVDRLVTNFGKPYAEAYRERNESKPPLPKLPDNAYARTGFPVAAMKWRVPPSWGEAKDGLRVGIRVNGDARIGSGVNVEVWGHNSGTQDVNFQETGSADVGLSVFAKDSTGKVHDANITRIRAYPVFHAYQLPPEHILKVKEFKLLLDSQENTRPRVQAASLHLPPGDYQLRVKWGDAKATNLNEGEWTGEITSGEVDLKITAANSSVKPPGERDIIFTQPQPPP